MTEVDDCMGAVGSAATGGRVRVRVRRVADMKAMGGRGEDNDTEEGLEFAEEVGREEVEDVWRLRVAEGCELGATLNTAIACSMQTCV